MELKLKVVLIVITLLILSLGIGHSCVFAYDTSANTTTQHINPRAIELIGTAFVVMILLGILAGLFDEIRWNFVLGFNLILIGLIPILAHESFEQIVVGIVLIIVGFLIMLIRRIRLNMALQELLRRLLGNWVLIVVFVMGIATMCAVAWRGWYDVFLFAIACIVGANIFIPLFTLRESIGLVELIAFSIIVVFENDVSWAILGWFALFLMSFPLLLFALRRALELENDNSFSNEAKNRIKETKDIILAIFIGPGMMLLAYTLGFLLFKLGQVDWDNFRTVIGSGILLNIGTLILLIAEWWVTRGNTN